MIPHHQRYAAVAEHEGDMIVLCLYHTLEDAKFDAQRTSTTAGEPVQVVKLIGTFTPVKSESRWEAAYDR